MKCLWTDPEDGKRKRLELWGLYKKGGLFRRRLICYFMSRQDARDTAKCVGSGFTVARLRWRK